LGLLELVGCDVFSMFFSQKTSQPNNHRKTSQPTENIEKNIAANQFQKKHHIQQEIIEKPIKISYGWIFMSYSCSKRCYSTKCTKEMQFEKLFTIIPVTLFYSLEYINVNFNLQDKQNKLQLILL
jgi:hypothetical protein